MSPINHFVPHLSVVLIFGTRSIVSLRACARNDELWRKAKIVHASAIMVKPYLSCQPYHKKLPAAVWLPLQVLSGHIRELYNVIGKRVAPSLLSGCTKVKQTECKAGNTLRQEPDPGTIMAYFICGQYFDFNISLTHSQSYMEVHIAPYQTCSLRASSYEPGWPGWLGYRDEFCFGFICVPLHLCPILWTCPLT